MSYLIYVVFFVLAGVLAFLAASFYIPFLQRLKCGQSIRAEGPETHLEKSGTPTMGGLIFLTPLILLSLPLLIYSKSLQFVIIAVVGYALIGFWDDFIKVVKKRSMGLNAKQKLAAEVLLALMLIAMLVSGGISDTKIWIPLANVVFDLGIFYYFLVFIIFVATTNAVNLTDGVDGLSSGAMCFSLLSYVIIAHLLGKTVLAIFAFSFVAALLSFLWYNFFPAKIFMGDAGALAMGGGLAALAIATKTEILLLLIGALYVAEALSVIIQVSYFKWSKGKRIFRMSPLHHHFELGGWSEKKVVYCFWAVSALTAALGSLIFYCSNNY